MYAHEQAARPDFLVEAWRASSEALALQKRMDDIHSGQGSIANYEAFHVKEADFWENLGFYQQANGLVQTYELFKRQIKVYVRNPLMSTSRYIAAICVALFFGGAFYNQGRNVGGYDAKSAEGFAVKLMVPGFGSAAIAYCMLLATSSFLSRTASKHNSILNRVREEKVILP